MLPVVAFFERCKRISNTDKSLWRELRRVHLFGPCQSASAQASARLDISRFQIAAARDALATAVASAAVHGHHSSVSLALALQLLYYGQRSEALAC
jgi:hypothetical protein